jgi:hypothetical protein
VTDDYLCTGRPFDTEEHARSYMGTLWELLVADGSDVQWSVFTVGRFCWLHKRTDQEQLDYLYARDTQLPVHRAGHGQLARSPPDDQDERPGQAGE